jgi:hypothetical protein
MLSKQAIAALVELEAGAKMNCLHTVARELIAEGLAFDGWGQLEITEAGRRAARSADLANQELTIARYRNFGVDDPNYANLHGGETAFETPGDSHHLDASILPDLKIRGVTHGGMMDPPDSLPPDPDAEDQVDRNKPTLVPQVEALGIPWSRSRAMAAAGEANGRSGIWVDEKWVACFLDAYEAVT